MNTPLFVLIAACGQPAVLARTLQSLAACDKPEGYAGVIVAENGPRAGLEAIVAQFPPQHRFQYRYSQPPNKSLALNRALEELQGALVVFTDDDVQVPRETLVAYARVAAGCCGGEFYGGPIVPDYEGDPPPAWLAPMLPRSAAGWKLDVIDKTPIAQPEFIGPNFAAFAADILNVGGYDTRLGPGRQMLSPGEDTEIQERLLAHGVSGYYVPGAAICHLVRADAVTVDFAVHRAERNGMYWGISQARRRGFFPHRWLKVYGQWLNDRWRISRWLRLGDELAVVRASCLEARWRGRWQGIRAGWKWDAGGPNCTHVSSHRPPPSRTWGTDKRAA
jgi:glycosyltransferase involved in cell wall biosynthesis